MRSRALTALRPALLAAALALALPAVPVSAREPVELGAAVNDDGFVSADPRYRQTLARYEAATAESAFKIAALQPAPGQFSFGPADAMVAWSGAQGQRFHGHTLVWCDDQWLPAWLLEREWTRDELLAVMREHIATVMEHFGAAVDSWDVVNEAFDQYGDLRDCLWSRVIGGDYVEQAFRAAREAAPGARLFYNEYRAEWVNARFLATEEMARDFLARGVPLDGIGLQMHLFGRAPPQYRIEEAIARVEALGLDVHVSELDDTTSSFPGTTEEKLAQQAQAYQTVAAACQTRPACGRITTWGFTDAYSWRGPAQMALPFDVEYRPKPAWEALQRVLRAPAPAPGDAAPGAPGTPVASAAPNRGQFTVAWTPAQDPEGAPLTYALQHRDADDAGWATIASGIRGTWGTSYAFSSTWPERQGTWTYRVIASDAARDGPAAEGGPVTVDRAAPARPVVVADRPPELAEDGGWHRDEVTLSLAGLADPDLPDGSPGSGVDPASVPAAERFTATGSHAFGGTVRDRAGNESAPASGSAQVDADAPWITSTSCPAEVVQGAPASITWRAGDEGSGLETPPEATVTLDTAMAGERTATFEARDRVGHTTVAACEYRVRAASVAAAPPWRAGNEGSGLAPPPAATVVTAPPVAPVPAAFVRRPRVGVRIARATRRSVTLAGSVTPAAPGARVSAQRRTRDGSWLTVRRAVVRALAGGRSRYTVTVPRTTRRSIWRVLVTPRRGGAAARGVSRQLRVRGTAAGTTGGRRSP